ncbi:thiol reductant ABC exporter subunit CydD [Lentibacillus juripiscarius]|uniref:Thiol reductant ABC exporter subunit CydD n=1 Tax=Lentibacillus juripiscarius TaxID=257446 RepID=A0ABW5V4G3_9BACI
MDGLRSILLNHKKRIIFLCILAVITAVTVVLQAYFLSAAVDHIFVQGQTFSEISWMLAGLAIILLLRTTFTYTGRRTGIAMAADVKAVYRKSLLDKFAGESVLQAGQGQSGGKISILLDAVDEMDSYFSEYIPQLIQASIIPVVILTIAFTQHIHTGLIMIITAPFIPLFMIIIGMQTKNKSEEQQEKLTAFSGQFLDALQGLTTLKLYRRSRAQEKAMETSSLSFRDATMEILKIAFTSSFMLELISMLSIGIVALELAIQMIIYEQVSFFTAFFLLMLAPEYYATLKELGSTFHSGQSSKGAAAKVINELAEETDPLHWGNVELSAGAVPPSIQLQQAGYHYEEGLFSLKNINATFPPRGNIAIVGRSGSGKSTLLHLIAGLLPLREGNIMVNDHSLAAYSKNSWFSQLNYISQHPYLFSGTIAENIAIGSSQDHTRGEIERAAEQAGIAGVINQLEQGYDTPVGEAGRGLSGGEMQRLALARAFLKKPSIILFDEPTTGLDLYTERILYASIRQLAQQATVITVAHRLYTIKDADTILFLEHGRLLAAGTHSELLRDVPEYREMVFVHDGGKNHE